MGFAILVIMFSVNAIDTVSGDYVIYKDNSFKSETWVGFLYYDDFTYGAVLYTPSENRRISIGFSVSSTFDKMELKGQKLVEKIDMTNENDIEAVNYLMQLLPNLYAWGKKNTTQKTLDINRSIFALKNIFSLGGDIKLTTASYVPVFGIEKIESKDKKTLLQLNRIGRVKSDSEFYNFILPFETTKTPSLKLDQNAKKQTIDFAKLKIKLDSQWTKITENSYFLGDIAFLTFSPLSEKLSFSDLVSFFCLSSKDRIIETEKMQIQGNHKKAYLTNLVYDTETQTVNVDKKLLVFLDKSYFLVSLTVAKSDYEKYKTYFDKLF